MPPSVLNVRFVSLEESRAAHLTWAEGIGLNSFWLEQPPSAPREAEAAWVGTNRPIDGLSGSGGQAVSLAETTTGAAHTPGG